MFSLGNIVKAVKVGKRIYDTVNRNKPKKTIVHELSDLPIAVEHIKSSIRDMDKQYGQMTSSMRATYESFKKGWEEIEDVVEALKDYR